MKVFFRWTMAAMLVCPQLALVQSAHADQEIEFEYNLAYQDDPFLYDDDAELESPTLAVPDAEIPGINDTDAPVPPPSDSKKSIVSPKSTKAPTEPSGESTIRSEPAEVRVSDYDLFTSDEDFQDYSEFSGLEQDYFEDDYFSGYSQHDEDYLTAPHRLFDNNRFLQRSGLNIYGWVSQGFTANAHSPNDRFNGVAGFNDRSNDYQLNQVYAVMEHAINPHDYGLQLGGRIDVLYGSDSRYVISRGFDAHRDGTPRWNSGRFNGLAIPQAYAEASYDALSLKVGRFYSILGYDQVQATENFFYSQTYALMYGEPRTLSGALATYRFNDQLRASAGYTFGWDNFEDINKNASVISSITFNNSDESQQLTLAVSTGNEMVHGNDTANRTLYSIVYQDEITSRLTYVAQHDNGWQADAINQGQGTARWYGINQQLIYKLNQQWSAGVRAEWFRDAHGYRVHPVGDFGDNAAGINSNVASVGGFEGDFYGISVGLNYRPTNNLRIRPEFRYDMFDGDTRTPVQPFRNGSNDSQYLAAFDIVYEW